MINNFEIALNEMSNQIKENVNEIQTGNILVKKTKSYFESITESCIQVDNEMRTNAGELQYLTKKMKSYNFV